MVSAQPHSTQDASPHAMFPAIDRHEASLLDFAVSLKERIAGPLTDKVVARGERLAPDARAADPADWQRAADILDADGPTGFWGALRRSQQEFYLDVAGMVVHRQLPELIDRYREIAGSGQCSSLSLDDTVAVPAYQAAVDIHCVPGAYAGERTEDDVYAGARSDLGSMIFAMRRHGRLHDDKGVVGARLVKQRWPDLPVRRIVDFGCTVGNSTLPYADAFPEAEIHALDVAAPCLRYGHARARALGYDIHFSQQDVENTRFEDGSVDLVVSHILLHETSFAALVRIFAEAHRILRPGGVMVHVEVPIKGKDALAQYFNNWDARFNNEPFWASLAEIDLVERAVSAGFAPGETALEIVPTANRKVGGWMVLSARKEG